MARPLGPGAKVHGVHIKTLRFRPDDGWLEPLPTAMDGPRTLVLAFGASAFADDPEPLAALAQAFPRSVLTGCSTSGEIAGTQVHDDSISLAVARFEHSDLRRAATELHGPVDSWSAGARLARELHAPGLRAVFVLSDGLNVNGSALVAGLAQNLGDGVAVSGGLAGDGSRFARTWVLDAQGRPVQRQVAAVGLYGERLRLGHGYDGGWSDFGPERRITRSEGHVLYELDGRPALDLYKQYLGDRAAGLPGTALLFPLALKRDDGGEPLVRTILGVDEQQRSMTFAGDMPQGGAARLMRANSERLIGSAGEAVARATRHLRRDDAPLVISVSCVGRRLVLGERTEEEVETVVEGAPCRAQHVGFYSYGEISPALAGGASDLHNQTMTVTVIGEAAD